MKLLEHLFTVPFVFGTMVLSVYSLDFNFPVFNLNHWGKYLSHKAILHFILFGGRVLLCVLNLYQIGDPPASTSAVLELQCVLPCLTLKQDRFYLLRVKRIDFVIPLSCI